MDHQKWENLPLDCLAEIFSRVGVVPLVEDIPFVCKSWYKATMSPLCWKSLFFQHLESLGDRYDDWLRRKHYYLKTFVKFVIRRSHGSATAVAFSSDFPVTQEMLNCIGEGCPSLKRLVLPSVDPIMLSSVICKWKNLEALEIITLGFHLRQDIIAEISAHCKNFVSLDVCNAGFEETEAIAISTLLSNIEFLYLRNSYIERSDLVTILKGCKKLVHFDSGLWRGFDLDEVIKNLAAHITTFKFEVLKIECSDDFDTDSGSDYDSEYGYDVFDYDRLDDIFYYQ